MTGVVEFQAVQMVQTPTAAGEGTPGRDGIEHLYDLYEGALLRYRQALQSSDCGALPSLKLALEDDEPEDLVIDEELFSQLFDIYTVHGWSAIAVVQAKIQEKAAPHEDLSGGTSLSPWPACRRFFLFTRNLLALLIRAGLIEIERKCRNLQRANLQLAKEKVDQAWDGQFRIRRTVRQERVYTRDATVTREIVTYTFGAKQNSAAALDALKRFIPIRQKCDAHMRNLRQSRTILDRLKTTGPSDIDRVQADLAKSMEEAVAALDRAVRSTAAASSPMVLLLSEVAKAPSTQESFENLLGEALWRLRTSIQALVPEVAAAKGEFAALLPGMEPQQATVSAVEDMDVPLAGFEADLIDRAFRELPTSARWFALTHESTMWQLLSDAMITPDSFAYIVHYHFTTTLLSRLDAQRLAEAETEAFWAVFSKCAAALSLVLLFTPAGGLSVALRGVATVADLGLMAHSIHSVVGQLSRLDETLGGQLVGAGALSLNQLSSLGQLIEIRATALNDLAFQMVIQLAASAVGSQWIVTRNLLAAQGYLADVETLLASLTDKEQ